MFDTPYQTTPCNRFSLDKLAAGVRRLEIDSILVQPEGVDYNIALVPASVTDFLPFQQPLTKREVPTLEHSVVIDGRSMLRANGTPNKHDVYNHAILTAVLTDIWYTSDVSMRRDFLNLGDLLPKAFISWMSNAIALRLGLDFGQTSRLRGVVAIYYVQLHGPLTANHDLGELDRLVTRAARYLPGVDAAGLLSYLGDIPPLHNISDFVKWATVVLDSPRMEQLTVAALNSYLGYSFGPSFRESVAVALEYPPVFTALVYTACNERSYTKSGLGKVIENLISRGSDKEFTKNVKNFITK